MLPAAAASASSPRSSAATAAAYAGVRHGCGSPPTCSRALGQVPEQDGGRGRGVPHGAEERWSVHGVSSRLRATDRMHSKLLELRLNDDSGPACPSSDPARETRMPPLVLHVTGARPELPEGGTGDPRAARHAASSSAWCTPGSTTTSGCPTSSSASSACPSPTSTSGSARARHAEQTAAVMAGLEPLFLERRPDARRRLRRRELDRRRGPGRREAADPARARRGRAAQLRRRRCPRRSTGWSPTGSPTCCSPPAPDAVAHLGNEGVAATGSTSSATR